VLRGGALASKVRTMNIELVPPIVVYNHLDGVCLYLTPKALCDYLESWYITDEKFDAYDAEGRAVELRLDERKAIVVRATELEPTHAPELRAVLLNALMKSRSKRYDSPPPGIEAFKLSELVAAATERLEVVPWKHDSVLARAFRRIRNRGQESQS